MISVINRDMKLKVVTSLAFVAWLASIGAEGKPLQKLQTCGYPSCKTIDPSVGVHVHLVPHSHDDVGWLKNPDEYYYGDKNYIQRAGVQYILDSVIQELAADPTKRYIQVETAFFWRWWKNQDFEIQNTVKNLVNEGRLEFIGGGWSMNDEATTHYSAIIDNMGLGMKFLKDTFGQCSQPRVAWQIDPFGHSKEQARLFSDMGFDGLFFARADHRDKDQRKANKTLQMLWNGGIGDDLSKEHLFTGMFSHHYSEPAGFCFDVLCNDEPVNDDPTLEGYNVDAMVKMMKDRIDEEVGYYNGPSAKHIMFTIGSDFQYQNAAQNFLNWDKMILHFNKQHGDSMKLMYSTPSCFINAIHQEQSDYPWPVKQDDFFPYADPDEHSYWTGYFSSRPSLKLYERQSNNILQAAKQIDAIFGLSAKKDQTDNDRFNAPDLNKFKRAMGTMQHHDAVTGTEKQAVAEDYAKRLSAGQSEAEHMIGPVLFGDAGITPPPGSSHFRCGLTNVSECQLTNMADKLAVLIYNPLPRKTSHIVRIPLGFRYKNAKVYDDEGNEVMRDIFPVHDTVLAVPGRKNDSANYDIYFKAEDLPPMGYKTYLLEQIQNQMDTRECKSKLAREKDGITVEMGYYKSGFADGTKQNGSDQQSGAYIFRPSADYPDKITLLTSKTEVRQGCLVNEEWHMLKDPENSSNNITFSFVVRTFANDSETEVEWMAGPIALDENTGKEVVMVYKLPEGNKPPRIEGQHNFRTDANGRQYIQRTLNSRDSYNVPLSDFELEFASSNYYPITTGISIAGSADDQMDVLTDRAQGATSLRPDEVEIMVHRRLKHDDNRGVGEALDEQQFGQGMVARGKHLIRVGPTSDNMQFRRWKSQELYMQPLVLLTAPSEGVTVDTWQGKSFSGLNKDLPEQVHVPTLEFWGMVDNDILRDTEVLVRFEHLFDKNDGGLSVPVSFDLTPDFFKGFTINNCLELYLGADRAKEEFTREMTKSGITVNLEPFQIRTYKLSVKYNN